jgi:hypothetical protein
MRRLYNTIESNTMAGAGLDNEYVTATDTVMVMC